MSIRRAEIAIPVELPAGTASVPGDLAVPAGATMTAAITHGAGSGRSHPFLVGFAEALNAEGVATLRFDLPYRAAGRRMPGPAAHAIAAWRAVMARLDEAGAPSRRWAAGKSYGGRMASMAAAEGAIDPAGLVYLGYPLHPPGRPDRLRAEHLSGIRAPQLFVSGGNDPFVTPHAQLEEAVAACPHARITWIDGANHSFEIAGNRRPAEEIGASLAPIVAAFLRDHP